LDLCTHVAHSRIMDANLLVSTFEGQLRKAPSLPNKRWSRKF